VSSGGVDMNRKWPKKFSVHLLLAGGLLAGTVQLTHFAAALEANEQTALGALEANSKTEHNVLIGNSLPADEHTFNSEKTPQPGNPTSVALPSLHGYVVENPIAYAPVAIYAADTLLPNCFNERAPLQVVYTDAQAHFSNLSINTASAPLFIVVADSSRGRDQVSGGQPVLQRLITVAAAQQLSETRDIIISPLTTLAFYSVMAHCGDVQTAEHVQTAFDSAIDVIIDNFPALSGAGSNTLTEPPLLNDSELTAHALQQRIAHRVITQGIAVVAAELATMQPNRSLTSDDMLQLMAADIAHDGQFDGYDGETLLTGIDNAAYARTLGTLHARDSSAPLSDINHIAQADALIYGASVTFDSDSLPSTLDADAPLMRTAYSGHNIPIDRSAENFANGNIDNGEKLSQNATNIDAATQRIQLHWDAGSPDISGYEIFVVNNSTHAIELVKSLGADTPGFNLRAPSTDVELPTTWKIADDQATCFQIRAFNEAGTSELSEPVCGMI